MEIYPNITSDLKMERNMWETWIIDKLISIPAKCPLCSHVYVNMVENKTLNNPYIARCKMKKNYIFKRRNIF